MYENLLKYNQITFFKKPCFDDDDDDNIDRLDAALSQPHKKKRNESK